MTVTTAQARYQAGLYRATGTPVAASIVVSLCDQLEALQLAFETELSAANMYAKQVAHWIEKHDALLAKQLESYNLGDYFMSAKHKPGPVFISEEQVQQLNEKHGWFEFRDAQSDVSNAFANEAIERYERIRAAAPELLIDLIEAAATLRSYEAQHRAKNTEESTVKAEVNAALATRFESTIAKAQGGAV